MPKACIPTYQFSHCPKGVQPDTYLPGDFILISDGGISGRLIQFGQRLRYMGADAKFAKWNHVALIVAEGTIIESDFNGIHTAPLSKYLRKEYYHISILASEEDRAQMLAFATACLKQSYGWWQIASIALSLLTGLKFGFGVDGEQICSGLVTRSLERTKFIPKRDPAHTTPADLAKAFISS